MISVQVLGGGADAAGYYLDREGCEPELDPGATDRAGYYLDGRLDLDAMVTKTIGLDDVEAAFEDMAAGRVIRSVIVFD